MDGDHGFKLTNSSGETEFCYFGKEPTTPTFLSSSTTTPIGSTIAVNATLAMNAIQNNSIKCARFINADDIKRISQEFNNQSAGINFTDSLTKISEQTYQTVVKNLTNFGNQSKIRDKVEVLAILNKMARTKFNCSNKTGILIPLSRAIILLC
jgi:hypothetical protein